MSRLLLLLPFVFLLWLPFYNHAEPSLAGFPFFYWYQFLWVFLAAICTYAAYRIVLMTSPRRREPGGGER